MYLRSKSITSYIQFKFSAQSIRYTCYLVNVLNNRRFSSIRKSYWSSLVCVNKPVDVSIRKLCTAKSDSTQFMTKMAQPLNQQTAKDLIESTDAFLFDCDGVLWNTNGYINGSPEAISKLKELGKKVFYVTNNSSKSRQDLLDKCKQMGFVAEKDDVICTSYIAAEYLKQIKFDGKVYLMGKEESIGEELKQVGLNFIGTGPDPVEGSVEDWLKLTVDKTVNCVLVGFDPDMSYMKIMKAATYLRNSDCLFLATNLDTNLPTTADVTIPGTGCMVVTVSHAARRKPLVVGKPEPLMFDVLKQRFNLDPSRCLMVGDMLSTDIKFAKNCGMKSLLVLSGNTKLDDLKKPECPAVPDLHASRLGEILNYI